MRRNGKWIFASFLFALFCGYMISITCFVHSHIVDGQRIVHSHPYKGAPDNPEHSHTAAQFISIALLSHFVTLVTAFIGLGHIAPNKTVIRKFFYTFFYEQVKIFPYALRAPPVL